MRDYYLVLITMGLTVVLMVWRASFVGLAFTWYVVGGLSLSFGLFCCCWAVLLSLCTCGFHGGKGWSRSDTYLRWDVDIKA